MPLLGGRLQSNVYLGNLSRTFDYPEFLFRRLKVPIVVRLQAVHKSDGQQLVLSCVDIYQSHIHSRTERLI